MRRNIWFWRGVSPLLLGFCRLNGVAVNRVVNLAVEQFLGVCDVEELRLKARVAALLREEAELRRVCNAMLRSGSYLPRYVEQTLESLEDLLVWCGAARARKFPSCILLCNAIQC